MTSSSVNAGPARWAWPARQVSPSSRTLRPSHHMRTRACATSPAAGNGLGRADGSTMTARPQKATTQEAFQGSWHITETKFWDSDALDMVQPAFIRFDNARAGSMGMIVIQATSTAASANAMVDRWSSSRSKGMTTVIRARGEGGRRSTATGSCAARSSSTWATTASSWPSDEVNPERHRRREHRHQERRHLVVGDDRLIDLRVGGRVPRPGSLHRRPWAHHHWARRARCLTWPSGPGSTSSSVSDPSP
jgi:hypothetical protein